jgi:hypothetical protein
MKRIYGMPQKHSIVSAIIFIILKYNETLMTSEITKQSKFTFLEKKMLLLRIEFFNFKTKSTVSN